MPPSLTPEAGKLAVLASLQATALRVKHAALQARHPDWDTDQLHSELRRRFLQLRDAPESDADQPIRRPSMQVESPVITRHP